MRLLRTSNLKFEEVSDERDVRYAILSHRWEHQEVSLHDMLHRSDLSTLAGYQKISRFRNVATSLGFDYIWVDTCCIDKSSSAELQEAINSMFRWYRNAEVCCVYLSDWSKSTATTEVKSKWFTRGWTLQELIAPKDVRFYDASWEYFGNRKDLANELFETTRLPRRLLSEGFTDLSQFSIAERMSWAHGRETTRIEDRAYSLLGIFDVNMPMLYGEGEKAFLRLQEEIVRKSSDQSILAWIASSTSECFGLFASSPDQFPAVSAEREWQGLIEFQRRASHTVTNDGLTIELLLTPWQPNVYLALLNYKEQEKSDISEIIDVRTLSHSEGIFLKRLTRENYFVRIVDGKEGSIFRGKLEIRPLHKVKTGSRRISYERPHKIVTATIVQRLMGSKEENRLASSPYPGFRFVYPNNTFKDIHLPAGFSGPVAYFAYSDISHLKYIDQIMLGFDFDYTVVIVLSLDMFECQNIEFSSIESHRFEYDNVATKDFSAITCMEGHGWIPIRHRHQQYFSRDTRTRVWPMKMDPIGLRMGHSTCSVNLQDPKSKMQIELRVNIYREKITSPWVVNIKEGTTIQTISDDKCWFSCYNNKMSHEWKTVNISAYLNRLYQRNGSSKESPA